MWAHDAEGADGKPIGTCEESSADLLDFEVTAPSLDLWPQVGVLSPDFKCSLHVPAFPDHHPLQFIARLTHPPLASASGIRRMWGIATWGSTGAHDSAFCISMASDSNPMLPGVHPSSIFRSRPANCNYIPISELRGPQRTLCATCHHQDIAV
jgi:hypothetical protein